MSSAARANSPAPDEFRYHTPSARDGILYIRSLPDASIDAAARNEQSVQFAGIRSFMGPACNPAWIAGACEEEATRRHLALTLNTSTTRPR